VVKFITYYQPAKDRSVQINGHPYIRIRIVILNCGKEDEQDAENKVKDSHLPANVMRNGGIENPETGISMKRAIRLSDY
jgi:hypothetical protein